VVLEVEKIRNQQQGRRQDDISKAWSNNRDSIKQQNDKDKQWRQEQAKPLFDIPRRVPGEDEPAQRKFAKVWRETLAMTPAEKKLEGARKLQLVELTGMAEVEPPPLVSTWAPLQRNILVEATDHISNIPYFGDDVIEKDAKFINTIVDEVNTKMSIQNNLDDNLFLLLVSALSLYGPQEDSVNDQTKYVVLFKPDTKKEKDWVMASMSDSSLPGLVVFQAISSSYPEFGTTDELITKYRTLTAQKAKPDFVPNIDGPEAVPVSAERALHSYKSLLCRRCFLYDCPLHNDPYVDQPIPRLQPEMELPLPSQPCSGTDCFLSLPGVLDTLSPRTPHSKGHSSFNSKLCVEINPLRDVTGSEIDLWTGSEITFFRVLAKSFPSNWCAIAQVMITKKCRQIYQFSLEDAETAGGRTRRAKGQGSKGKKKPRTKAKQAALYKGHSQGGERENNHTYTPCYHPGQPCSEDVCSCRASMNFCEKFCYCPPECTHRFPGCKCRSKCTNKLCACFFASRECDPDLCTSCLDPALELNPETSSCRNVVLQRKMDKKLYVAPSDIAGWGCFIGEKVGKNDFIAEYVGEMITQEESERRGKVYDKAKCSYMFNLNDDYCVDAARVGGKIRFANHSSKPNCKVKILLVNGDHRIGIYANKNIDEGEELFFNYGKDFHGHDIV